MAEVRPGTFVSLSASNIDIRDPRQEITKYLAQNKHYALTIQPAFYYFLYNSHSGLTVGIVYKHGKSNLIERLCWTLNNIEQHINQSKLQSAEIKASCAIWIFCLILSSPLLCSLEALGKANFKVTFHLKTFSFQKERNTKRRCIGSFDILFLVKLNMILAFIYRNQFTVKLFIFIFCQY